MKQMLFIICLFCVINKGNAQNRDAQQPKTTVKTTTLVKPNSKLLNQKLLHLQTTIKKLETILKEANALMDKLKDQKDSLSDLSEQDMLMLQQLMEKKSQLESMISNVMKASAEAKSNIARNLKSS